MMIVHINTELRLAWRRGLQGRWPSEPADIVPYKLLPRVVEVVQRVVHATDAVHAPVNLREGHAILLIVSKSLGVLGVAAGLIGYLPQIGHLVRGQCSAGISRRAYVLWLTGSLLLLTHALMIPDGQNWRRCGIGREAPRDAL